MGCVVCAVCGSEGGIVCVIVWMGVPCGMSAAGVPGLAGGAGVNGRGGRDGRAMARWTPKGRVPERGEAVQGVRRWMQRSTEAREAAARGLGQSMSAMRPPAGKGAGPLGGRRGGGEASGSRRGAAGNAVAHKEAEVAHEAGAVAVAREAGAVAVAREAGAVAREAVVPPAVAEVDFVECAKRMDHGAVREELKRLRMVGAADVGAAACSREDADGRAPLSLALRAAERLVDAYAMTLVLLEGGAAPRAKAGDGRTALMEAAERGWSDVVVLLLNYGSDPTAEDNGGARASAHAGQAGHDELQRVLQGAERQWDEINGGAGAAGSTP